MGAVVNIKLKTSDPNYRQKIRQIAERIEAAAGEHVDLDIGVVDRLTQPDAIEKHRTSDKEKYKIR